MSYFYRPNSFQFSYLKFEKLRFYYIEAPCSVEDLLLQTKVGIKLVGLSGSWQCQWIYHLTLYAACLSSLSLFIGFFCFRVQNLCRKQRPFFFDFLRVGNFSRITLQIFKSFWFQCFDRSTCTELLVVY